jgi:prepilin-type N-terminal cleavage/methylation domain-containing protein
MNKSKRAFTIIELMIVVIILGIVASMSIPSYLTVRARTYQEKMKSTLSLIAQYEELSFVENGYYSPGSPGVSSYTFEINHDGTVTPEEVSLSELPFVLPDNRNYDYRIYWVRNDEEHYFYAEGIASKGRGNDIDGDTKMDHWQISSYTMEPIALSDDLGKTKTKKPEEDEKKKQKEEKQKEKEEKKKQKQKEKEEKKKQKQQKKK